MAAASQASADTVRAGQVAMSVEKRSYYHVANAYEGGAPQATIGQLIQASEG